ncbi:MAG TPA: NAD-dependent DNA ligase LigA [Clostridiaceae bacterium]
MEDKVGRVKDLVGELNQYRHEYYNLNKPSVSDATYDQKFDELQSLENETGVFYANSPTQTVGYEVISKLQKVTHITPLKSLAKTKSQEELNTWRKDKETLLMFKGDGLTVELDYDNGLLTEASTRGNGEIGEVITHNARTFKNIPLSIPFKGKLRISGEAMIHKKEFDLINSTLSDEDKYATPRNLVAGSVRQLSSKVCSERSVEFYAFNILECSQTLTDSKYENFEWLWNQGIDVIHCDLVEGRYLSEMIEEMIEEMKQLAVQMGVPIDGLVISFDSVSYSNSLQETSHHPLHSLAYKFFDESTQSILRGVEWRTTRMGQVNPTAIFDTVSIDNTDVNRASLHNLSFIEGLQLSIGSRILVSKRNLIIPHIEDNLDRDLGSLEYPSECPACGEKTAIKNTGTADFLFCENVNCSAKLLDKFVHFVKRDCMNIDGLSSASLELFINEGFLQSFDDIYNLEAHDYQIKKLEGWGSKSYTKLIEAIDKSRKVKCANFIYALGIPNVGSSSSKIIAKHFNNDFCAFEKACVLGFDFSLLEDFGSITDQSIHNWYASGNELNMWMHLMDEIEIIKEVKKEVVNVSDNPFKGSKCYATGSFANYKKEEIKAVLEGLGAEFAGGYAKSLTYLIEGSLKSSSKVDKAKKDGIPVISEEEFMKMIGKV